MCQERDTQQPVTPDSLPPEGGDSAIARLRHLAEQYRTQEHIISGVDEAAVENNRLVLESLTAAGERLKPKFNEVFGIHLGGSRIKGYNTVDSDIDLVIVAADTTTNTEFVWKTIREELDKKSIKNGFDGMMGMWASYEVKIDPDEFLYTVDHQKSELITLYGFSPYQNPNLLLARLTTLEVIDKYTEFDYPWDSIADEYARTYLGEREHLVPKFAERYGVPTDTVGRIFSTTLFHARHQRFGLKDPKTQLGELRQWRRQNARQLNRYVMNGVYKGVLDQL